MFPGASQDGHDEFKESWLTDIKIDQCNYTNIDCDANVNSFFGKPASPL